MCPPPTAAPAPPGREYQGVRHGASLACALCSACRELLEDEHVLKVGVGVRGDARDLQTHLGVTLRGAVNLEDLATATLPPSSRCSSAPGDSTLAPRTLATPASRAGRPR